MGLTINPKLSVNVNKIALIRNSRGEGARPNLLEVALNCVHWGADGITVHPRPDGRHIRREDIYLLAQHLTVEFNIEGYPSEDFLQMVCEVKPAQCTLVPDPPEALTSSEGWDTLTQRDFLRYAIERLQSNNIRTSIFVSPDSVMVRGARDTFTDRIELYTGPYAYNFGYDPLSAITPYMQAAQLAFDLGIGLNAGHDLNLLNLRYFKTYIPNLLEVSIGHALICDSLYMGLEKTIGLYLNELCAIPESTF